MKPRLPSASLTAEDYDIFTYGARWRLTHEYAQLSFRLDRISETQDRRDADIMLSARTVEYGPVCAGAVWLRFRPDDWIAVKGEPLGRRRLAAPALPLTAGARA